jgi:hypothetical protein
MIKEEEGGLDFLRRKMGAQTYEIQLFNRIPLLRRHRPSPFSCSF